MDEMIPLSQAISKLSYPYDHWNRCFDAQKALLTAKRGPDQTEAQRAGYERVAKMMRWAWAQPGVKEAASRGDYWEMGSKINEYVKQWKRGELRWAK